MQLLLDTLDNLIDDDLKIFKWYLTMQVLDSCRPIPKSKVHSASRTETVTHMIESYGQELAVNITHEILMKMSFRQAADNLKSKYGGSTSTSSSAAAPLAAAATITAETESTVIAPAITGSSIGSLNITIKK